MKITVFTPTYNRGYIIENLYKSLQRQTFTDFEWLVVDDGSKDNTEELFDRWKKEDNNFNIRYYKKENGGKCRAINYALDKAKGELFFTVDSDDYLTNDALEKINKWENELDKSKKIAGIVANRGYDENHTINNLFSEDYLDLDLLQIYTYSENGKKVLDGERAFIFYTDIHRKYKYPEFDGEKFMTEAVTWNRMANDGYIVRYFNDIIWIFEYLEDGLTKAGNKLFLENPKGYGLWLKEKTLFEKKSILEILKLYYSFYCELYSIYSIGEIADYINTSKFNMVIVSIIKKIIDISKNGVKCMKKIIISIMYKLKYFYNNVILANLIKPQIASIDKSLDYVINNRVSVSRFGDGELALINMASINFQEKDKKLSDRLKEILQSSNDKIAICIPNPLLSYGNLNQDAKQFWKEHLGYHREIWYKYLNKNKLYYNTQMTRLYMDYEDKSKCGEWFDKIKQVWEGRDIVIIEGKYSKLGVGNDLFDNSKSIERILAPSENAFSKYDCILKEAKKIEKDKLILIALGPTATVLAYDLALEGYQAIDIGHIDIEYEWFLKKSNDKVAIKGKYTNESKDNDVSKLSFNSEDYTDKIRAIVS